MVGPLGTRRGVVGVFFDPPPITHHGKQQKKALCRTEAAMGLVLHWGDFPSGTRGTRDGPAVASPYEAAKGAFPAPPPTSSRCEVRGVYSAVNKAPLDVQGRGRYSFRFFRRAFFGLFLAGFGLFLASFAHWGGLGAHLGERPLVVQLQR